MIVTYMMDTDVFSDSGFYSACLERVSEYRRKKALSYRFEKDRRLSLAAGVLIDYGLRPFGLSENTAEFYFGKNEKPYLKNGGVFFNASHSGRLAVCSFSENEIGVDAEELSDVSNELIESVCVKSEEEYIKSLSQAERQREFFRLWTAKESYMKLLGTGLSLHPKKIELSLGKVIKIKNASVFLPVFLKEYSAEGCCLTACSETNDFAPEAITLTARDIEKELMI